MNRPWIKGYKPAKNVGKNVAAVISDIINEIYDENTIDLGFDYSPAIRRSGGPSKGPSPRKGGYVVGGKLPNLETAFTYVARFGKTDIYKIGYSNDPNRRLSELNKHIPTQEAPELDNWKIQLTCKWDSILKAYDVEQKLLEILDDHRTEGERVKVPAKKLKKAWDTIKS